MLWICTHANVAYVNMEVGVITLFKPLKGPRHFVDFPCYSKIMAYRIQYTYCSVLTAQWCFHFPFCVFVIRALSLLKKTAMLI